MTSNRTADVWLVEDDGNRAFHRRRGAPGNRVTVRLHRVEGRDLSVIGQETRTVARKKSVTNGSGCVATALALIDSACRRGRPNLIVAGASYGCRASFLNGLADRKLNCVVELRPSTNVKRLESEQVGTSIIRVAELIETADWVNVQIRSPVTNEMILYSLTDLGRVMIFGRRGRLLAAQTSGVASLHGGTILALSTSMRMGPYRLLEAVSWARWVRPLTRREERVDFSELPSRPNIKSGFRLKVRANIHLADQQDKAAESSRDAKVAARCRRGMLDSSANTLNVIELFAGGGGMGLGFLNAQSRRMRYRLVYSAELNPIYTESLRRNHAYLAKHRRKCAELVPESTEPVDLSRRQATNFIAARLKPFKPLHLLIGGPPCQGFSVANRNSWHSANPNNELVDVFARYVTRFRPLIFVMENVQGILWTGRGG